MEVELEGRKSFKGQKEEARSKRRKCGGKRSFKDSPVESVKYKRNETVSVRGLKRMH